jgi:predicted DCC family thiol-disulfide oxidoreductase YuxK
VTTSGEHVALYDGLCGLCDKTVRFVLDHDRRGRFRFAPLQSAYARAALAGWGRDAGVLDTFFVIADAGTSRARLFERGRASVFLLHEIGGGWRLLALFLSVLPGRVLDAVYDAVARSRYRVFGRRTACRTPSDAERARFIDA